MVVAGLESRRRRMRAICLARSAYTPGGRRAWESGMPTTWGLSVEVDVR